MRYDVRCFLRYIVSYIVKITQLYNSLNSYYIINLFNKEYIMCLHFVQTTQPYHILGHHKLFFVHLAYVVVCIYYGLLLFAAYKNY